MKLIPIQRPQINHNDVKVEMKGDQKSAPAKGGVVAMRQGARASAVVTTNGVKTGPSLSVKIECKTRFGYVHIRLARFIDHTVPLILTL
jgi:hypothetical protein